MDGMFGFSILSLFNVLTTDAPLTRDRSVKGVLKFDITLVATVLTTIVIWVAISRIGSMIFIPLNSVVAVLLTLGGIAITLVVVYLLIAYIINDVEHHITEALNTRHAEPKWDNTRKPIRH